MQYTLGQACRKLATTSRAYGAVDMKEAINDAIQALAGLSGWECLRKVLRIFSAQPAFALPQGCAGLVRACVGGRPVSVRGQDFEFLHSGPGDLRHPPPGFFAVPPSNIVDRGYGALMVDPPFPFQLEAETAGTEPMPELRVRAVSESGEIVRLDVPVLQADSGSSDSGPDLVLRDVLEVAVDTSCATAYTDLYAVAEDGSRMLVARYHPEIPAPRFRKYEIQGLPPGSPVDVLAEVRLDPLPLVSDADVLPFDSLEPVEWMIQASWYAKSGEIEAAQKMHTLASGWLKAREVAADVVQAPVVVNSLLVGSAGEVSIDSVNI